MKKTFATLKYEGINSLVRKSYHYTKRKLNKGTLKFNCSKDVLFINGCTLPHPTRYRVDHQIEQLHFNGYACDSVYYENLTLDMLKYYRGFVFFRCPHTELIEEFVVKAKYFNKAVIFDIDDLVIDYNYVKDIKYLSTMSKRDFDMYMDGVNRMKRTLLLCDSAITTTARLATELKNYVPNVFINRNVASEKMVELSQNVLKLRKESPAVSEKIILGYFSGSITHNADFNLILPIIRDLFEKNSKVYLKVVGLLDIPDELEHFKDRIITEKFTDWTNLPELIASVDVNLAPLETSIFNEAKSENKWVEAALVKVPTIASNVGAFTEKMTHDVNGILCDTSEDWKIQLERLVHDEGLRMRLGRQAYEYVMEHCTTAYSGYPLFEFLEKQMPENIAFVLPSTQISGGVNVVIKHCHILREAGMDVTIISMNDDKDNVVSNDGEINVLGSSSTSFHNYFHKCVATLWSTTEFINKYPKIKNKYYLVQNFETNFYEPGHIFRVWANLTYNSFNGMKYITISKWCKNWLEDKFNRQVHFARNGINLNSFAYRERSFEGKIKILVEGNSTDYYKNVDESFKITNTLDRDKFEIWYLSYNGKPKEWYKVDKFLHKVPYDQVGEVYGSCDILLKSSLLESFSYPPLEMMATGGVAVVAPNHGNVEYLVHNENSLLYGQGNVEDAVEQINKVCEDKVLRSKIIENGVKTAASRSWDLIEEEVLNLYEVKKPGLINGEQNE
ncbi:glycosyltransferase [Paenibacillus caseinilyticus]|nr:glycosyltransferase [Paenibacillus mucilaginosus]